LYNIIFVQINEEHIQKQERTDGLLLTDYVVVSVYSLQSDFQFFSVHFIYSELKPVR